MRKQIKKISLIAVGILLIIFGIIAMPLPVLPGFIFILVGILIVSFEYPTLALWLEKMSKKNEKIAQGYSKALEELQKFFKIDK